LVDVNLYAGAHHHRQYKSAVCWRTPNGSATTYRPNQRKLIGAANDNCVRGYRTTTNRSVEPMPLGEASVTA
jgi:hypothetical protein